MLVDAYGRPLAGKRGVLTPGAMVDILASDWRAIWEREQSIFDGIVYGPDGRVATTKRGKTVTFTRYERLPLP